MKHILITASCIPDIDGVACAIAYQSFLQQIDPKNTYSAAFQDGMHIEAQFVLDALCIAGKEIDPKIQYDNFILVDMSERCGMPDIVVLDKVQEIIDHRMFPDYTAFPYAKFRIEPVGAAATQIAEFFYFHQDTKLDATIAQLLLCAIYSNTINFKADVSTFRDLRMKERLEMIVDDTQFFRTVFAHKTQYAEDNLYSLLLSDMKDIPGQEIGVFQIELYGAQSLIQRQDEIISLLQKLGAQTKYCMLIIQDILSGETTIMSRDDATQHFIEHIHLPGRAGNLMRHIDTIMMRKSIIPYLRK